MFSSQEPKGWVNFIGLNPSTADEETDDPTVRRCINFARNWRYGGCVLTNLFAFRATNPKELRTAADPVGPDNNLFLTTNAERASLVIAAWGVHGRYMQRDARVLRMLSKADVPLHCLGLTKAGHPRHPLYLRAHTKPIPYSVEAPKPYV